MIFYSYDNFFLGPWFTAVTQSKGSELFDASKGLYCLFFNYYNFFVFLEKHNCHCFSILSLPSVLFLPQESSIPISSPSFRPSTTVVVGGVFLNLCCCHRFINNLMRPWCPYSMWWAEVLIDLLTAVVSWSLGGGGGGFRCLESDKGAVSWEIIVKNVPW